MARTSRSSTRTVVVGVAGGIAAYKGAILVREFRKHDWTVHVVPTRAALNFVGKTTWEELSENPVATDVFSPIGPGHVELARRADLIVVAPTTADLLARIRAGRADDLLTTTILASSAPVLLAPAMHSQMWANPATVENVDVLRSRGYNILEPDRGPLSSGDEGVGRLPDPLEIFARAQEVSRAADAENSGQPTGFCVVDSGPDEGDVLMSTVEGPLAGVHVVITAGGTQEPIDPVRFVGNRSSGHQGMALVRAALDLGAEVTLVAAATTAPIPASPRVQVVRVESASEMARAVYDLLDDTDVLIMAAAVADFTPVEVAGAKIKKTPDAGGLVIEMRRTEDILATVAQGPRRPAVLIGFGAETGSREQVLAFGSRKAQAKGADLLAVNEVGNGTGFGNVPNTLVYFDAQGDPVGGATGSKDAVATDLLERAVEILEGKD